MLIRIVRMTFKPEEVSTFLQIFESNKEKIRHFPGCRSLNLHQDYNADHIYATYSIWENNDALESYRSSTLFREVWKKTKPLFADKPIAFSLKD